MTERRERGGERDMKRIKEEEEGKSTECRIVEK